MRVERDSQALRIVLIAVGLIFIFGVWVLMRVWPSGWQWQPSQPEYEQMIMGVYATLGVFLLLAARELRRILVLMLLEVQTFEPVFYPLLVVVYRVVGRCMFAIWAVETANVEAELDVFFSRCPGQQAIILQDEPGTRPWSRLGLASDSYLASGGLAQSGE